MPEVRSAAVGAFVGTGSRDETPEQAGISHFLEHLLFKGSPHRSAREIAEAIDAVGGDMNAFTSKEYTTFYLRLLAAELPLGLDILCELLQDPALREQDIDAERQVILEEVLMHLDEPADVVQEHLMEGLFPDHPLGREVLGLPEVITSVSAREIRAFFERHYRPANMVIAVAGAIEHEEVAEMLEERFSGRAGGEAPTREAPGAGTVAMDLVARDCEQAQLTIGMRAPDRHSSDRYRLAVLNHTLGGGISSRLFQEIREERGLAYAVGSERTAFEDAGALTIAVATAPERAQQVLDLTIAVLDDLRDHGVRKSELELAKSHLRADLVLSLEDSGARMGRIGAAMLLHGEVEEIDEVLARLDEVDEASVGATAASLLSGPRTLAVVGPYEDGAFSPFDAERP
jgi:predicted Zn-dependent peptidase